VSGDEFTVPGPVRLFGFGGGEGAVEFGEAVAALVEPVGFRAVGPVVIDLVLVAGRVAVGRFRRELLRVLAQV